MMTMNADDGFNDKYFHDLCTYTYDTINKTFAFASGEDNGIYIIDVTNPVEWVQLYLLEDYKEFINPDGYLHQNMAKY